jgi:ketosteroid isomerase-like protein
MLSHRDAVALFDHRREAWLREDVDGYLALWADDMTFQSPVHREPLRGREAFARLVRDSLAAARPVLFDVTHLAVSGDVVLAEWRIAIERRDGGRRIEWPGMSVAGLEDGRIVWWREYWNPVLLA